MFGMKSKIKTVTADVHPTTLFRQELSRILSAARSRQVGQKTLADICSEYADSVRRQASICYEPTRVYSGSLPQ